MSNKPLDKLNPLDKRLRALFPVGMRSSVDVEIRLVCGFELFNTRAYHNYETWSNGYQAWIDDKLVAEAEDLDDLIGRLEQAIKPTEEPSDGE